jgi:hypothetical protein
MTPNVGKFDRAFRLILGLLLIFAPLLNFPAIWSDPTTAYVTIAVGCVLAATSLLKFCPLYRIVGLSTCRVS